MRKLPDAEVRHVMPYASDGGDLNFAKVCAAALDGRPAIRVIAWGHGRAGSAGAIEKKVAADVFSRVIYTEDRDQVGHPPGQNRLPALIDTNNPESVFAKKRSTQAAAVMLTAPGIPMIFQGQEMLEARPFGFLTLTNVDFTRVEDGRFKGIVQMYRDLIALRRNFAGKTKGLTGQNLNVFHLDTGNHTLAYHRWERRCRG